MVRAAGQQLYLHYLVSTWVHNESVYTFGIPEAPAVCSYCFVLFMCSLPYSMLPADNGSATLPQPLLAAGMELGVPDRRAQRRPQGRLWASVRLFELHPEYDLLAALIGPRGQAVNDITIVTHAKIRVRGTGAVPGAPSPLMVTVSADQADNFLRAMVLLVEHLQAVTRQHETWCRTRGLPPLRHSLFGIDQISDNAGVIMGDLLARWPPLPLPPAGRTPAAAAPPPPTATYSDSEDSDGVQQAVSAFLRGDIP